MLRKWMHLYSKMPILMSAQAKEMLWSQLGKYKRKIPDPTIPSWIILDLPHDAKY